jgi:hypothetical protein
MVLVQTVELWGKTQALELLMMHFRLLQERRQLTNESALLARLDSGRRYADCWSDNQPATWNGARRPARDREADASRLVEAR